MLKDLLESYDIFLPNKFYINSNIFIDKLLEYNKIHNISGVKNKKDIEQNILDSIFPMQYLNNITKAIDIGTGAGFPGLLIAMAYENIEFTLIEPITKRSSFLYLIKTICKLQNVKIVNDRVENIKPFKVDLITSRAVSDTKILINIAKDFIDNNTVLLFYKGENVKNELIEKFSYNIIQRDKRRYLFLKAKNV